MTTWTPKSSLTPAPGPRLSLPSPTILDPCPHWPHRSGVLYIPVHPVQFVASLQSFYWFGCWWSVKKGVGRGCDLQLENETSCHLYMYFWESSLRLSLVFMYSPFKRRVSVALRSFRFVGTFLLLSCLPLNHEADHDARDVNLEDTARLRLPFGGTRWWGAVRGKSTWRVEGLRCPSSADLFQQFTPIIY